MPPFRRQIRVRAFGMVDALVGILILAAVGVALAQAFLSIGQWDQAESLRIDRLTKALDAEAHVPWL